MIDRYFRYYVLAGHGLILLWIVWWLVPLSVQADPYGAIKVLGFLLIQGLFLVLGIFGYVLCAKGLLNYEVSTGVLVVPFLHLAALLGTDPGTLLEASVYAGPLVLLPITTICYWLRFRR